MKNDFIMPILVLSLICLVISGALAVTNSFTEPVIAQAAQDRASAARKEIIPHAEDFLPLDIEGLPATVREVYKSTNGVGYIFAVQTSGYGGDMNLTCGIDPDGIIIQCKVLEHSETKGLGSKISESFFSEQFEGKDASLSGVSAISGATISSGAYISAVRDALSAYELVKEVGE